MGATNQILTTTKIDIATSTDVIAAVAGQTISIFSGFLVAASTVTLTIKSAANVLTGAMTMAAGQPYILEELLSGQPLLVCNQGEKLTFTLGSGVQVSGWIKTVQA